MNVIQPHCRDHLTAGDVDFLVSVLSDSGHEASFITSLLSDPEARDRILDAPSLVQALQDSAALLKISACLYFYILVRHSLRRRNMDSRLVADYIAEMLAEFLHYRRVVSPYQDSDRTYEYLIDLMQSAATPNNESAFICQCHLGNYALFLSGLYPERITAREKRRAAPGLDYFENMGRSGFQAASACPLAEEFEIRELLKELAEDFHPLRLALNAMTQQYLFITPPPLAA